MPAINTIGPATKLFQRYKNEIETFKNLFPLFSSNNNKGDDKMAPKIGLNNYFKNNESVYDAARGFIKEYDNSDYTALPNDTFSAALSLMNYALSKGIITDTPESANLMQELNKAQGNFEAMASTLKLVEGYLSKKLNKEEIKTLKEEVLGKIFSDYKNSLETVLSDADFNIKIQNGTDEGEIVEKSLYQLLTGKESVEIDNETKFQEYCNKEEAFAVIYRGIPDKGIRGLTQLRSPSIKRTEFLGLKEPEPRPLLPSAREEDEE